MSDFAGGKNQVKRAKTDGETDAMGRRVWDKEKYKVEEIQSSTRVVAAATSSLEDKRDKSVVFQVNQRRIVTNASSKANQGGFYCEPCDCLLRDSAAYLDHVNGRTHNKICGMNMQVEQVGVDRVIARMKFLRYENDHTLII